MARRGSRFCRSSSRIRSRSAVVTPDRRPLFTCARRTHRHRVTRVIPKLAEIDPSTAHSEGYSPPCSSTIRTARSRSSCGYLVGLVISPSSQRMESPTFPGRFTALPGRHRRSHRSECRSARNQCNQCRGHAFATRVHLPMSTCAKASLTKPSLSPRLIINGITTACMSGSCSHKLEFERVCGKPVISAGLA
jgi:hypothetical protein